MKKKFLDSKILQKLKLYKERLTDIMMILLLITAIILLSLIF